MGKAHVLTTSYDGAVLWNSIERSQRTMVAEPIRVGTMPSPDGTLRGGQAMRVYSVEGKGVTLKGCGGGSGAKTGLYAEPVNTRGGTDSVKCNIRRKITNLDGRIFQIWDGNNDN